MSNPFDTPYWNERFETFPAEVGVANLTVLRENRDKFIAHVMLRGVQDGAGAPIVVSGMISDIYEISRRKGEPEAADREFSDFGGGLSFIGMVTEDDKVEIIPTSSIAKIQLGPKEG